MAGDGRLGTMAHPVEEALERADAMLENGHAARAIQQLELVLFRFPGDARLVIRLGELYLHRGDKPGAASYYLEALRLDPADQELQLRMSALLEDARDDVETLAAAGGADALPAMRRRRQPDVPTIKLDEFDVSDEILELVPKELVERFRVVPVARSGETLLLATAQPENRRAVEEIGFVTGLAVNCAVATDAEITSAIQRFYGGKKPKKKRDR